MVVVTWKMKNVVETFQRFAACCRMRSMCRAIFFLTVFVADFTR